MNIYEIDKSLRSDFGESESRDADGIQINVSGNDIKSSLVTLDCTSDAIDYAKSKGIELIVTHHPLIFHPLKNVCYDDSVGKRVLKAINCGISVISYHTCLDKIKGGVNDSLCGKLGFEEFTVSSPYMRIAELGNSIGFDEFLAKCEESLMTHSQNFINFSNKVKKTAIVSGSGKDFVKEAFMSGADTYITGELSHDTLIDCKEYGMNVICLTHFASENVVLPFLSTQVKKYIPGVSIYYGV